MKHGFNNLGPADLQYWYSETLVVHRGTDWWYLMKFQGRKLAWSLSGNQASSTNRTTSSILLKIN